MPINHATFTEHHLMASGHRVDQSFLSLMEKALETSAHHDLALQEILTHPIIETNQVWVLTQYHIHNDFDGKVMEGKVSVTTTLVEMNRFFAHRRFVIEQGDQRLLEIYAQFAAIDFQERKMARLNIEEIQTHGIVDKTHDYKFPKIKIPKHLQEPNLSQVDVKDKDIDSNNHVNNLVYIDWCLQVTAEDIWMHYDMETLDVKFGKEIRKGQSVEIRQRQEKDSDGLKIWYDIYNVSQQEQAALALITWKKVR